MLTIYIRIDMNIIGDSYKKFGSTIYASVSQNKYTHFQRFFNYILLTPKERKNLPTKCNLYLGSEIHKMAQKIICEKKTLNQAFLEHEKN